VLFLPTLWGIKIDDLVIHHCAANHMTQSFASRLAVAACSVLLATAGIKTGPQTGQRIPDFSAPDQNGTTQSLKTIAGPKGAMLVFYRSADW
jgi:hypothetical protein